TMGGRRAQTPCARTLVSLGRDAPGLELRRGGRLLPHQPPYLGPLEGHSHARITRDALEALDAELFGVQTPTASMRSATEEIVNGNVHVDDDQMHSALHFDGENFVAGQGRILGLKEAVIASIQQNDARAGSSPKKAKRLRKQARHLLTLAGKAAGKTA